MRAFRSTLVLAGASLLTAVSVVGCASNTAPPSRPSVQLPDGVTDEGTRPGNGNGQTPGPSHPDGGGNGGEPTEPRRVIYQLVVRTFGNTKTTGAPDGTVAQNGVGKFSDINSAALTSLRSFGVTDIWLTGVLRQATLTDHSDVDLPADDADVVKGRAGSFYAVRDYFDVSPDYANDKTQRLAEFDALVARIHAHGMRVHLDFVPNHVARNYGSVIRPELDFGRSDDGSQFFSATNDFYYLAGQGPLRLTKPAHWNPPGVRFDGLFAKEDASTPARNPKVTGLDGTRSNPSADEWYETVKLNWGVDFRNGQARFSPTPPVWTKMDAVLAYWQDRGIDGFRCDFAHVIPNEAWRFLTSRARERHPGTYFFAEAYASLEHLVSMKDAGFDALYHDAAVDELKRLYRGESSTDAFSSVMNTLGDDVRGSFLHYLENHDERRVASPIVTSGGPDDSGFGGMTANYQLAPLLYLYSQGPVLIFNGQEVGEPGAGNEGFSGEDGRTSIFDYTSSPQLVRWSNNRRYDGGGLDENAKSLRKYLGDLLTFSQSPLAVGRRYWGLAYHNRPDRFADAPEGLYSFARFETDAGALLVVAANFRPGQAATGKLRIPAELVEAAKLPEQITVTLRLDRRGQVEERVATVSKAVLVSDGFEVRVPDQTSVAYELR